MPCYVTYKTFGYVDEKDLKKIIEVAREEGYRTYNQFNGIEFRNGRKQFGLLKTEDGRYQYRSESQSVVDEIKNKFNRQQFAEGWKRKNPGWQIKKVQVGGYN